MNSVLQIGQEQYLGEAAQRALADKDLASYGEYIYPDWFRAYDMHRYIAYYLEQVVLYLSTGGREGIQNLMILTPPQHGKSVIVSNVFPSWTLGKLPDTRVLMASYGADLSTDNSREVRNIVTSAGFRAVFGEYSASDEPVRLSSDSRSTSKWDLAKPHRGGCIATGVGGAFSGRAKGVVLLDDLIKDHRAAESQATRDDVWDWIRSSVIPRARALVLVMTHWNADDPAGRFMKLMVSNPRARQFTIIALPGFAFDPGEYAASREEQREKMLDGLYLPLKDPLGRSPGEVLCPAMLSKEEMLQVKETSDDYFFSALYQQLPFSKEGQKYKREHFKIITQLPEGVTLKYIVRCWDKAASASGDYTVGVLMGFGSDGVFYILDVKRGRWSSNDRDKKIGEVGVSDKEFYEKVHTWHQQDPGSAGLDSAIITTTKLLMNYGVTSKYETMTGSKEVRSDALETAFAADLVRLLKGAWNTNFIEELVSFNHGVHDDQVDAASDAYNRLFKMISTHRKSKIQ